MSLGVPLATDFRAVRQDFSPIVELIESLQDDVDDVEWNFRDTARHDRMTRVLRVLRTTRRDPSRDTAPNEEREMEDIR